MNDKFWTIIGLIIFFTFLVWIIFFKVNPPLPPLIYPTPIPTINTCDMVTQTWLYCWNTGNPYPHHLGYRVYGDHYCTNRELGKCN